MSQYPIVILDNDENRADFFESRFSVEKGKLDKDKSMGLTVIRKIGRLPKERNRVDVNA